MPKKAFVVFLISLMILPSGVMSVPHYGDLAVITDAKNNKLILQGDTVTIGNSTDTVVISRSDTGIDFNGAYFDGVNWEESDLENLDADQLDGLEGDSYLKSDRVDTFTGGKLIFDDNAITKIDWANSDDGPGSELDADLWDGNQYSDIDSDGDNQVDEADDADNVRSTYKGNDIDNDADGKVNESVDADNVKSTYKGNDIDGDGDGTVDKSDYANDADASTYKGNDIDDDSDGKVNNSDQLDGYEASEFATTSEADTQISVYDSQTFLGAVRTLDFDTDLNATVPGTDTAFISIEDNFLKNTGTEEFEGSYFSLGSARLTDIGTTFCGNDEYIDGQGECEDDKYLPNELPSSGVNMSFNEIVGVSYLEFSDVDEKVRLSDGGDGEFQVRYDGRTNFMLQKEGFVDLRNAGDTSVTNDVGDGVGWARIFAKDDGSGDTSVYALDTAGNKNNLAVDDFEADRKITTISIPLSEISSGDTAQVIRHLPSSETMEIYRMGVKNDSFNSVTGLKAEIVNDAGTIIESTTNGNYEPSTSISSDNYIFRINNDSGGSENASAFFEIIYN